MFGVNAAIVANVATSGVSEAKPGDTVTVNLNVNVTSAGEGVDGLVADISYPKDVLTLQSSDSYIYMEGLIMVTFDEPATSGTKTIPLTFTINKDTTAKEAKVDFSNIKLTDADKTEIKVADTSKTIKIVTEQTPSEEPKEEQQKKDNTTADKTIDKAGLEFITIPGIALVTILAIVSYKKYKNLF